MFYCSSRGRADLNGAVSRNLEKLRHEEEDTTANGLPVSVIVPSFADLVSCEEDRRVFVTVAEADSELRDEVRSTGESCWDVREKTVEGDEERNDAARFELLNQGDLHDLSELCESSNIEGITVVLREIDDDKDLSVGQKSIRIALITGVIWVLLHLCHGSLVEV